MQLIIFIQHFQTRKYIQWYQIFISPYLLPFAAWFHSYYIFSLKKNSTTTPVIDPTKHFDGINSNDDNDEDKEENGEYHDSDFWQTQKGRKSDATTSQEGLTRRQKPTTTSETAGMKVRKISINEIPAPHGKKRKSVQPGPNTTGTLWTTETNRKIKEEEEFRNR